MKDETLSKREAEVPKAKAIIADMTEQVRTTWYEVARAQGVSEKDAEAIRAAFVYEGFSR